MMRVMVRMCMMTVRVLLRVRVIMVRVIVRARIIVRERVRVMARGREGRVMEMMHCGWNDWGCNS